MTAAAQAKTVQFDIPAQAVGTALLKFAEQARMQVTTPGAAVQTISTAGVRGQYEAGKALEILLRGTGLKFRFVDNETVVVTEEKTAEVESGTKVAQAEKDGGNKQGGDEEPPPEPTEGQVGAGRELAEIVVTAQKRSERLQDVPSAVSALTGATLEAMGAESFTDYARSIPGLTFQDQGAGRQLPTLRGLNPTTGAAAVGYYIGETPIPNATGGATGANFSAGPTLIDIDRIEVLRGPQGTLYGSSSIGGTIKLVPHAPNLSRFEGSAKAEALMTQGMDGASPGGQAQLVLNVPIVEGTVAVRGAFWYRNVGGFINRTWTNAGEAGIATGPIVGKVGNIGDEHTWGFRTTALYQPTERLSLSAMAYLQRQHFDGSTNITGGASNPNDRLVQNFISDVPEPQESRFALYNLTAKYGFDRFNVVSSTSYSDQSWRTSQEGTSAVQAWSPAVVPNVGIPFASNYNFTQEARLATNESIAGFDATIGVYYSKAYTPGGWIPWSPPNYNELVAGNDPANPLYAPNNNLWSAAGSGYQRETAEFGELTFHMTDKLSLTGGLRHYDVAVGGDYVISGWFVGGNVPGVTFAASLPSAAQGNVYKGNLSYKLTPDHLLYAQYSEGFRPGFGNSPISDFYLDLCHLTRNDFRDVQPDSIKNYELGAKTGWLDQRLTVNAAAYRIDWTNIQQARVLQCGLGIQTNFGSAVVKGTELEASAQLTHRVSAGLSATYLHTEMQQDEPALDVFKGDPILAVPKWQYALYAQTTFPLLQANDGFARVDYQYTGSSFAKYSRLSDGSFDPAVEVQVVRLLNLRTGVRYHAWEFALSGTNLLNNTVRQSVDVWTIAAISVPGRPLYVITRPRAFSLSATYRF